jgi:hypothetical protein
MAATSSGGIPTRTIRPVLLRTAARLPAGLISDRVNRRKSIKANPVYQAAPIKVDQYRPRGMRDRMNVPGVRAAWARSRDTSAADQVATGAAGNRMVATCLGSAANPASAAQRRITSKLI